MKINLSYGSLHLVSQKVGEILLAGGKKTASSRESGAKYPNQFSSVNTQGSLFHKASDGSQKPRLSVKVLEQFVDQVSPKNISYHGFISSHLQHTTKDTRSEKEIKQALAIQRLLVLVNSTIEDMKKIELNHISKNKA